MQSLSLYFIICFYFICFVSFNFVSSAYTHRAKDVHNSAAVLHIQGHRGWLPQDVSNLKLTFSPPLEQGADFVIWSEPNKYVIPEHFIYRKSYPVLLYVLLNPGKKWIKDLPVEMSQELRLVSVKNGKTELHGYRRDAWKGHENVVARITNFTNTTRICPSRLTLPGASEKLQKKVDDILQHCQDPLIVSSRELKRKTYYSSLALLHIQPPMIFVNATDEDLVAAAKAVDRFLAAHSVLDVVWEPMAFDEPRYWILMPRPFGMPGHMFATVDAMQWRHPLVLKGKKKGQVSCPNPHTKCVPGCQYTQLTGITGSGYSADTYNTYDTLRNGYMRNLPVQMFPTTLGKRSVPPCK